MNDYERGTKVSRIPAPPLKFPKPTKNYGKCKDMVYSLEGYKPYVCGRSAVGKHGLCGIHLKKREIADKIEAEQIMEAQENERLRKKADRAIKALARWGFEAIPETRPGGKYTGGVVISPEVATKLGTFMMRLVEG